MSHDEYEIGLAPTPTGGCVQIVGMFRTEAGALAAMRRRRKNEELWVLGELGKLTRADFCVVSVPTAEEQLDDEIAALSPSEREEFLARVGR